MGPHWQGDPAQDPRGPPHGVRPHGEQTGELGAAQGPGRPLNSKGLQRQRLAVPAPLVPFL